MPHSRRLIKFHECILRTAWAQNSAAVGYSADTCTALTGADLEGGGGGGGGGALEARAPFQMIH